MHDTQGILNKLADLDARGRAFSLDLSGEVQGRKEDVLCVGFLACGISLLCTMTDLGEVIYLPRSITRVPGVQPWVRGVANVRGSLLPIVDLQVFLCGEERSPVSESRVLVADRGDIHVGLLVPAVYGMRHVSAAQGGGRVAADISSLREFVNGGYEIDGEVWPVFSMAALLDHPRFRVASL